MRIKELWIDHFKNLRDFKISFSGDLTSVILGGNGTGKSNLLEALAVIFRDLDLEHENAGAMPFEYYLQYECRGRIIEVDANPSQTRRSEDLQTSFLEGAGRKKRKSKIQFVVDGKSVKLREFYANKDAYLPKHVFGYYSGPTNRLAQHFTQHQDKFYEEQRNNLDMPLRPLFFALPVHSQFVLLSYFSFPDEGKEFLENYFKITDLESVLFVVKEPWWARADFPDDLFWGAEGIPRGVLQDLYDASLVPLRDTVKVRRRTGKNPGEERLYLFLKDEDALKSVAARHEKNQEFFKALDTLYIADLISEVRIRVRRTSANEQIYVTFNELSEGEQQLLTVLGLLKFTRDEESLFLLDEPDTHLNPAWKADYMRLIEPIVGTDTQCQILLVTHDPIVMGSCLKEQVRVLTRDEATSSSGSVTWYQPRKDPRGMGVAALLTSDAYGLRSELDWNTQLDLDRKRTLASKEISELTQEEKDELKMLNDRLRGLEFTFSDRDPLYPLFVNAMTAELDKRPDLKERKLTRRQQKEQADLAREIIRQLRKDQQPG